MFAGSRGWFLFNYFGRKNVKILNGGLPKWKAEGRPMDAGEYTVEETPKDPALYNYEPTPAMLTNYDEVQALSTRLVAAEAGLNQHLLDMRPTPWFNGEPGPNGARGGNIPGSVNFFFKNCLNEDNTFKTPEQIRAMLAEKGIDLSTQPKLTMSCATGVTACVGYVAILLTGYNNMVLNPGSWG
jgi:thiosulfate/3-mercaptopyruvate sulfurtransferase